MGDPFLKKDEKEGTGSRHGLAKPSSSKNSYEKNSQLCGLLFGQISTFGWLEEDFSKKGRRGLGREKKQHSSDCVRPRKPLINGNWKRQVLKGGGANILGRS